jgi:hypothetical protein
MSCRRLRLTVVIAVAAGLLAACVGSGADEAARSPGVASPVIAGGVPTRVELGLYSGVADPTWTLTTEEAGELAAALARLPTVDGPAVSGGLGYHGFSIVGPDSTQVAFDGMVAVVGSDPPSYLDDPDRTIERLLLETARTRVKVREFLEVARALRQP